MWVSGMELGLPGLVASPFTHKHLLVLILHMGICQDEKPTAGTSLRTEVVALLFMFLP